MRVFAPEKANVRQVLISLQRQDPKGIAVEVSIDGVVHGKATRSSLPRELLEAKDSFVRSLREGLRLDVAIAQLSLLEANLQELGHQLRALCLPGDSGLALADLLNRGAKIRTLIEVCVEAEGPELLSLPFEALRLPDGQVVATHPSAIMMRRPTDLAPGPAEPLAGPLKILVAVGAPDEGKTTSAVLDYERELQHILDAVEPLRMHDNADVRILEVGHPDMIAQAIERDAYHVLHISCHGRPGWLELEDEDGRPYPTTAEALIRPLRETGRPVPFVLLNTCHGGVQDEGVTSLAEALLRAGVPAVLAMQTSVSDRYATNLAGSFYEYLAGREVFLPSRALARARKSLEKRRLTAMQHSARPEETQPEYATAALFVAGKEGPLADFSLDKNPLRSRPVYSLAGPVPQLRMDDLIGRRKELRTCLRAIENLTRRRAGVVLTGIGGVGKSSVVGRAMQRLKEKGWLVAAHSGHFDLSSVGKAVGHALTSGPPSSKKLAQAFEKGLDDETQLGLLKQALAEEKMVLILDDFEQNLKPGGSGFLSDEVGDYLRSLQKSALTGRLLITSRYPIPGSSPYFYPIPVGPLSPAERRKMVLRLPALQKLDRQALARVLRLVGGHPRVLEFLDALLSGGKGRLPQVTAKLEQLSSDHGLDPKAGVDGLDEALQEAILVGTRDIFLENLLDIARGEEIDKALLQTAVSNLPVTASGLARMMASDDASLPGDVRTAEESLTRLEELSLLHRFPDGAAWVHRWTAEGLASTNRDGHSRRCFRAGTYRWWRVNHESHDLDDGIEAVRNYLAAKDYDRTVETAKHCFEAFRDLQREATVASLASEVLESLSEEHSGFAQVADEEATAYQALGKTQRALDRREGLLARAKRLAKAEPDRAEYQRDLAVSYSKMGDLYRALGQGEKAREAYLKDLEIAERLAKAEPDRAEYQRDLSVSYEQMGELYWDLNQGEKAREAYLKALNISERLAKAEPDRADYQRDLAVSYSKVGDVYRAIGQGEKAREAYLKALDIRDGLGKAEPDRAEYQRDLAVSYNKMGDLYWDLNQSEKAREAYIKDLEIAERLAKAEPDRADYQRDLSVSCERMGDLYRALGQGEKARQAYLKAVNISERLAKAEPDRADYQRDLSVSYERIGELYWDLNQGKKAREAYKEALDISERLAKAEPDRADYQRDLSVSYSKVGDVYRAIGQGEKAREAYLKALDIRERLAKAEPDRAEYQRDLSVSYNKVGDLYLALGQGEKAREAYLKALEIAEHLAKAEPDRAEYQRDLSVSCERMGDIYRALGQSVKTREAYLKALNISERLTKAEPKRADYQRDLSMSYNKMGDLYRALDQGEKARGAYMKALGIRERLAKAEPDQADYQRHLSVSYSKMGDLYRALGQGEKAREAYMKALEIAERLAKTEPKRADYQRDLAVSYSKMGDLYRALGQGEKAREAYLKDLEIAERLAKAEPDRADYQRDLAVCLIGLGQLAVPPSCKQLKRALAILSLLKDTGRLNTVDEPMVVQLSRMVADLC